MLTKHLKIRLKSRSGWS